ncbi:pilus assembly protein [Dyella soli]|uniref:Pilus assembly protein PilY n=2 Tax=Dyella soli TaxID=522319 RepID=A0A4V2NLX6_9GAMM|nr:pilus assembly protein PilY [Dyella soli]
MNTSFRLRNKIAGFLGKLFCTSLVVCGLGVASEPAYAAVTIDKAPLIIQASLPPDIVLMLDDSGSMASDYMPDQGYLPSDIANGSTSTDGYRNSANNGTYYNPAVTYLPPPKANGTNFYNAPTGGVGSAFNDGFLDQSAVDVTQYKGTYNYYTRFTITTTSTYAATGTTTYSCPNQYTLINGNQCKKTSGSNQGTIIAANSNTTYSCNNGDSLSGQTCTNTVSSFKYYFTYTTGPAIGPYVQHYVGKTGDCASLSAANQLVCDDGTTTQQNVANWFSYYRTRILMAKSGLMNSFVGIDAKYRVGFGSINNNNTNDIKAVSYTNSYNGNYIATVKPFGDGSTGTQKAYFWTWVNNITPNNSTPLRVALDSVGQYYQKSSQPWSTMSTDPNPNDPTELACRQAYTILTTDGFWNETNYNPSPANNADNVAGTKVTGPNSQNYTYSPAAPYSGSTSNTLADVAMQYWETDLRSSTANEVPTSTEDPAFWQHMVTFTLGLGFTPLYADKVTPIPMNQVFAWANGDTTKAISGFAWPAPASNSINNIADLAHAAVNGHGGFYSATTPQSFTNGLKDALKRASERVGTGASLAANSTQLQTGTVAYQANYYTAKWKGDLKALAINSTTGAISTTPSWTASNVLPAAASRNIYSYNPSSLTYMAFKVAADGTLPALSTAQLNALGASTSLQTNMINYLRGDATQEVKSGGAFRNRDTPIGDIVNSQPVYVGAPSTNQFNNQTFTGSTSFATYASNKASRTGLIYVAANDGMLHAFNASTGAETYAYLPGAVITSNLTDLSSTDYGTNVSHEFFNDGELTVADVYIGSAWKTVLVGTTGRGLAKTVYALDVTDPANIQFLWERSSGDGLTNSTYIGQMTGKPVIAQTADGTWSVLMGNGYNSPAATAALLQFKLSDGTLNVHATTDTSGLAAPAVWIDPSNNGISTMAYAGDADGNVWSFTLNTVSVDPNTGLSTLTATPSSSGVKLFTAKDSGNKAQPITSGMLAGKDPQTGNVWLFFGTGKYLTATDLTDLSTQTWYGLVVTSGTSNNPAITSSMGRSSLAQRSITSETAASGSAPGSRTVTTTTNATSMTGKSGWYIDLLSPGLDASGNLAPNITAQGERMVTPNQFQGNLLLGTTRIPKASDACNPSGSGWVMAVDPFTGTNPQSNFFDINGDGSINSSDSVNGTPAAGIGFSSLPNNPIFVGGTMLMSFDNGSNSSIQTSGSTSGTTRVSWRELINQ